MLQNLAVNPILFIDITQYITLDFRLTYVSRYSSLLVTLIFSIFFYIKVHVSRVVELRGMHTVKQYKVHCAAPFVVPLITEFFFHDLIDSSMYSFSLIHV